MTEVAYEKDGKLPMVTFWNGITNTAKSKFTMAKAITSVSSTEKQANKPRLQIPAEK